MSNETFSYFQNFDYTNCSICGKKISCDYEKQEMCKAVYKIVDNTEKIIFQREHNLPLCQNCNNKKMNQFIEEGCFKFGHLIFNDHKSSGCWHCTKTFQQCLNEKHHISG